MAFFLYPFPMARASGDLSLYIPYLKTYAKVYTLTLTFDRWAPPMLSISLPYSFLHPFPFRLAKATPSNVFFFFSSPSEHVVSLSTPSSFLLSVPRDFCSSTRIDTLLFSFFWFIWLYTGCLLAVCLYIQFSPLFASLISTTTYSYSIPVFLVLLLLYFYAFFDSEFECRFWCVL